MIGVPHSTANTKTFTTEVKMDEYKFVLNQELLIIICDSVKLFVQK